MVVSMGAGLTDTIVSMTKVDFFLLFFGNLNLSVDSPGCVMTF